jgi:hypothetical protein
MTLAAAFVASLVSLTGQQTAPANPALPAGTVTHDGCVVASQTARNAFTLDEDGQTYLLKGVDVRDLVGKRVQVIGATSKRLRIVGGLYPSPNVAAQAGGMDRTKAAIASQSGPTSQSARPTIEFNVKSVRVLSETCPETAR